MFPNLEKKLVLLYTLSTGLIMTLILSAAFLFYISSEENKQRSDFQGRLLTLTSSLQKESVFSDSFLSQIEENGRLIIHIEENNIPFFFPGSYQPQTDRAILLKRAQDAAKDEGIYPFSRPISSHLLQSSIFQIRGEKQDSYLGNVLIFHTGSGYKKLVLLQDISINKRKLLQTGTFYLLIDGLGILLLIFTGRRFVKRSLRPLEDTYEKQQGFVAAASHELRSPLTVIQTSADALSPESDENAALIRVIKSECQRGRALVQNLLLLVSAEQKNWAVRKQKFEVDELLLHLLELYEPLCLSRKGTLLLKLPDTPLPPAWADPQLCRQILTILLDNAAAYALAEEHPPMAENGRAAESGQVDRFLADSILKRRIILKAEYCHPAILISVIDYGPGIPDEEKKLIFDRFYRSDKSRSRKEHFGLGLSIAAALSELQGCTLSVQDTDGGGSTFVLRLSGAV